MGEKVLLPSPFRKASQKQQRMVPLTSHTAFRWLSPVRGEAGGEGRRGEQAGAGGNMPHKEIRQDLWPHGNYHLGRKIHTRGND